MRLLIRRKSGIPLLSSSEETQFKKKFENLIKYLNFGNAVHYCWRLEFQARGVPHIYAVH